MHLDDLTAPSPSPRPTTPRRTVLAGLAGLSASTLAIRPDETEAKKKRKRKKRNRKDRPQNLPPQDLPQIRPDAQCAGDDGIAVDSLPNGRIAQTFTAVQSGELVRAEVVFVKPTGTLGDFILHVAPVDAFGFPTNEVLATAVLPSTVPPPGNIAVQTFDFTQPATVVAGTQYALVLSRPEEGITGWRGRGDNGCAGRAFTSDDRTTPFVGVGQNIDLVFTTFVRS